VHLSCETTSLDEVTLVTARLHNETPVARRVQLRNRLDGPVMPPRTEGAPEAGWNGDGYEGVVPAESTLAVGYACPVSEPAVCDPPLVVDADERATGDAERGASTPEAVVRRLGRAAPPRDAVPTPETLVERSPSVSSPAESPSTARTPEQRDERATPNAAAECSDASDVARASAETREPFADTVLPDALSEWFETVETRVDRAERLTDPSVVTATGVLTEVGGLDAVDGLQPAVDADAERLRAVAERAETLAERAEATDVPLSALRRLA
jgi:hypothetical protein